MEAVGYAASVNTGKMIIQGWYIPMVINAGLFVDWTGGKHTVEISLVERLDVADILRDTACLVLDEDCEFFESTWLWSK